MATAAIDILIISPTFFLELDSEKAGTAEANRLLPKR